MAVYLMLKAYVYTKGKDGCQYYYTCLRVLQYLYLPSSQCLPLYPSLQVHV